MEVDVKVVEHRKTETADKVPRYTVLLKGLTVEGQEILLWFLPGLAAFLKLDPFELSQLGREPPQNRAPFAIITARKRHNTRLLWKFNQLNIGSLLKNKHTIRGAGSLE